MSARRPMNARLARLALAVADPTRMAADLGAVFGMRLAPDGARLRGPDGYELVRARPSDAPLQAIVIAVDDIDEALARLDRVGASRGADTIVDGRREVTYTGTVLGVPVTVRDRRST